MHNTLLILLLTNVPNKLEYYITQAWKGVPGTNTLAYLAICTPLHTPNTSKALFLKKVFYSALKFEDAAITYLVEPGMGDWLERSSINRTIQYYTVR